MMRCVVTGWLPRSSFLEFPPEAVHGFRNRGDDGFLSSKGLWLKPRGFFNPPILLQNLKSGSISE